MHSGDIAMNTRSSIVFMRWLALIIDNLLLTFNCLLFPYLLQERYGETKIDDVRVAGLYLVAFLFILLYFTITEGLTGYTVGKWICRIRVVREDGSVPGLGKALVRALFRAFEIYFIGLVGFLVAITSKEKQRLGDMAANTHVLYTKDIIPERRKTAGWRYIPNVFFLVVLLVLWAFNIINIGYASNHHAPTASTTYIVSRDKSSRLALPDGWEKDSQYITSKHADIKALNLDKLIFFMSHTYPKKKFPNATLMDVRDTLSRKMLKNCTSPKHISLHGYPALQFTGFAEEGLQRYHYLFTCVDAPHNYFKLTCWTDDEDVAEKMKEMKNVVQGFEEIEQKAGNKK